MVLLLHDTCSAAAAPAPAPAAKVEQEVGADNGIFEFKEKFTYYDE